MWSDKWRVGEKAGSAGIIFSSGGRTEGCQGPVMKRGRLPNWVRIKVSRCVTESKRFIVVFISF